jgi:DNA primase
VPFIDYGALKERVSMEQAVQLLGLQLRPQGHQLRGPCPICRTAGDRALVITPGKQLFYCFARQTGGDQIALVAHVKGCKTQDAAALLARTSTVPGTVQNSTVSKKDATSPPAPPTKAGFDPEKYAERLDPSHTALEPLEIAPDTLKAFKAGYASTGLNRGRLALPLYDSKGQLAAYCGRAIKDESPKLIFPNGTKPEDFIFNANQVVEGELYILRDPLEVLRALQSGVTNAVCFLTDTVSAHQLEMLVALLDANHCELVI